MALRPYGRKESRANTMGLSEEAERIAPPPDPDRLAAYPARAKDGLDSQDILKNNKYVLLVRHIL